MAQAFEILLEKDATSKLPTIELKNGKEYWKLTGFISDEKDKFGNDVSITKSQTKDEREAKEKKQYLGNGKVFWRSAPKEEQQETPQPKGENGLPF